MNGMMFFHMFVIRELEIQLQLDCCSGVTSCGWLFQMVSCTKRVMICRVVPQLNSPRAQLRRWK